MNDTVNAALDYVQRGFALTWMEHGTKRPTHPGWNTPENVITTSEQVRRKFGNGQALNIGLVHQFGTPRTCSLDVDQLEYTRLALAEVGIDLDTVRQGVPCVVGNPKGFRLEYRQPDGEPLPLRKLQWTDKSGRKIPVFELRAGANHDCLPPSLHPSGKLYEWTTPLPVDPAAHPTPNTALLEIWRNWSAWEPVLQAASPWAQTPEPAPRSREARADVIGAFNKAHEVRQILEAHGYKPRGKRRYLPPNSTSGVPSVRILDSGMVFSDNGSCPLNDGRAHDAFDCYRILEHGGDFRAATKAAAELLGMARLNSAPTGTAQGAAAERVAAYADDDCPIPAPLPRLPPVPDFPLEVLPDDLVPLVQDAAERARFRPDFAAAAIMGALGSVIGRKLGIRPKQRDDWTEYANVWAALVGPPSALKSPAMREAMKPLKALQIAADERHREDLLEYTGLAEAFKLRKEGRKKAAIRALSKNADAEIDLGDEQSPEAPVARTYWTSDATAERLGELLAENPAGLLVERDELSSLLVKLEDEASATARGLYLSGWSGKEGYRFDRIIRGTTVLPKFAISVVGGIQPGPLARYVRSAFSGERADGLLQRLQLIVWPDTEAFEYVDRWPDADAGRTARALFERADNLDPKAIGQTDKFGGDPPYIRLSPKAQCLFVDWYTQFMQSRRSAETDGEESGPLAAHFGKYPGLVGKLALILHVADDPTSREVSERTLLKALAWIDYLAPHARRVYHAVEHPETGAAELLLARLKRGDLPDQFKPWEISRKAWHGLTDREAVKRACRLLFEYGWLVEASPGGSQGKGRPADPVYTVSPKAGAAQ